MIYTLPDTRAKFLKEIDKYGDSFTKDTNVENLKEAFLQIEKQRRAEKQLGTPVSKNFSSALAKAKVLLKPLKSTKSTQMEGVGDESGSSNSNSETCTRERTKEEMQEEASLHKMKMVQLKQMLKEANLRVSGKKEELIERLLDHQFGDGTIGKKKVRQARTVSGNDQETEQNENDTDNGEGNKKVQNSFLFHFTCLFDFFV